ncbi:MAG: PIN domain-containing protein [Roseburia sp.]|nr:PIN domain-containing protein [Roseburia sp.]MCM1243223.1 PIN domain-containing protein [Roseburia sp.]
MKNIAVLIDTNIVLDVLEKREPFYESSNDILLCCASKKITGYIALHSISNIFYILRKQYSAGDRRRLILGILDFLQIANAKHENVRCALERNDFPDFEDCLQDECALENHMNYIITRNTDDFKNSRVSALTPVDFLQKYRP